MQGAENVNDIYVSLSQTRPVAEHSIVLSHRLTFQETEVLALYTWSKNKVRELVTVCLPWQQWTEISVRFDDIVT
jgi:hypothetical protein